MEQVQPYLDQGYQVLQTGFTGVNGVIGLVIALIVVMMMQQWKQWFPSALLATVLFHLGQALKPMLSGKTLQLPPGLVTAEYWIGVGTTFVGYLVVLGLLFFLKKQVFKLA